MSFLRLNFVKKINLNPYLRRNFATEVKAAPIARDVSEFPTDQPAIPPQTHPFVNRVAPTTTSILTSVTKTAPKNVAVSSFDAVPGPVSLYLLSRVWNVIPVIGTEFTSRLIQYMFSAGKLFGSQLSWGSAWWQHLFGKFFTVYGPVVRLHGPFGGDVVLISRPEHAKILFENELTYPVRASLDSVEKYCINHRRYRHSGLFMMHGPEWEKFRKSIEQPLHAAAYQQIENVNQISDEFLTRICAIRNAQEEMPRTFRDDIHKFSLECFCSVVLNKKLGFLDPCGVSATSDPGKLLEGLNGATEAIQKCEFGFHLWKFMETPAWKSMVKNCDIIDGVFSKYITRAHESLRAKKDGIQTDPNISLIEGLLLKENIFPDDIMTLLLDMMLIGINATTHTIAFIFYHLAKSPRCQQKLYKEVQNLPNNITKTDLNDLQYMKACIKEVLRLKPAIPFLTRVTNNDIVVHNYNIPKGTHVMIATRIASMKDEHFEDALKFLPERWMNSELGMVNEELKDFAFMPYGYGPKGCMAKELTEMQISLLVAKVLRKFRVEYFYSDIGSTQKLFATPDKPLRFRFVERI